MPVLLKELGNYGDDDIIAVGSLGRAGSKNAGGPANFRAQFADLASLELFIAKSQFAPV